MRCLPGADRNGALVAPVRPVLSAVTRYKMDCNRRQSMAIDVRYAGVDGAPAGVHSYPPNAWTPVAPGTVVDAIYSKVC